MPRKINSVLLAAVIAAAIFTPAVVLADNCGSFYDCYNTARAAAAAATALAIAGIILSTALDISPVGPIKAGIQAATGYDIITGEKVNRWEQAIGVVPLGGILRVASKGALHFARDTARVARVMEKVGDAAGGARRTAASVAAQSQRWRSAGRAARTGGRAADVMDTAGKVKTVGEAGQKIGRIVDGDTPGAGTQYGKKRDDDDDADHHRGSAAGTPSHPSGHGTGTQSR